MTTTAPATIRVREPRDLLTYALYAVGYRPVDSLVTLCLAGKRLVGPVARQDLAPAVPGAYAEQARTVVSVARHSGADTVVLAAFTEAEVPAPLLATIRFHLTAAGVRLLEAWQVTSSRYRSLTCSGRCCPAEGRPVEELASSEVGAEMVLRGRVVAPDRQSVVGDLGPVAGPEAAEADRVAQQTERAWHAGTPDDLTDRRSRALERWTAALDASPEALDAAGLGQLLGAMADLTVRDAIILTAVPGGADGAAQLVRRPAHDGAGADWMAAHPAVTAALDAAFGALAPGCVPVPPDDEIADRVAALLRRLARVAEGRRRARPLGVLAWLAWWRGDGVLADELVRRTLEADPHHSLGGLLRTALDRMVAPPWVSTAVDRAG